MITPSHESFQNNKDFGCIDPISSSWSPFCFSCRRVCFTGNCFCLFLNAIVQNVLNRYGGMETVFLDLIWMHGHQQRLTQLNDALGWILVMKVYLHELLDKFLCFFSSAFNVFYTV